MLRRDLFKLLAGAVAAPLVVLARRFLRREKPRIDSTWSFVAVDHGLVYEPGYIPPEGLVFDPDAEYLPWKNYVGEYKPPELLEIVDG